MRPKRRADDLDRAISANFRRLRTERGVTLTRCAAALGVSYQQTSKFDQGENRLSASAIVRLSRVLEVPVAALLTVPEVTS